MEILLNSGKKHNNPDKNQQGQSQRQGEAAMGFDIPNIDLIDTEGIPLIQMIVSQDNRAFSELSLEAKTRQLFPVITDILTFDPIKCLDPSFDERQLYASRQIKTTFKDQNAKKHKILNQKQASHQKQLSKKQSLQKQEQKRTTKIIRHDKNGNFRAFYYMLLLWIFNEKTSKQQCSEIGEQMILERQQLGSYAKQNDSFYKNHSKIIDAANSNSKQQPERQCQAKQSEQNSLSHQKLKELKQSSKYFSVHDQSIIMQPQMKLKTLKMLIFSNSTDLSIIQNTPQLAMSLEDSSTFYNKNQKLQNNHLKKLLSQFLQHLKEKQNGFFNKGLPEKIIEEQLNFFPFVDTLFICFLRSILFYRFQVQEAKDFNRQINDMTVFIALSQAFGFKDIKNPQVDSYLLLQKYHISRISISMRIFLSENSSGNTSRNTSRIRKSEKAQQKNSQRQCKQNIEIEELDFIKSSQNYAESSNKSSGKKEEVVYLFSLPDQRTKLEKQNQIRETEEIIEKINFEQTLSKVSSLGQFEKQGKENLELKKTHQLPFSAGQQPSFLRKNQKRMNLFNLFHESSQTSSIDTPIDSFIKFDEQENEQNKLLVNKSMKNLENMSGLQKIPSKCKLQKAVIEYNNRIQLFQLNSSNQDYSFPHIKQHHQLCKSVTEPQSQIKIHPYLQNQQGMKIIKQQDELASSSLFQTRMNTSRPIYMKSFLVSINNKKLVVTFTNLSTVDHWQYQETLKKNLSFQKNILRDNPIPQQKQNSQKSTDNYYKMSPSQNTIPIKQMSPYSNYTDYKGHNNYAYQHKRGNTQISNQSKKHNDNLRSTTTKINPFSVNDYFSKTPSKQYNHHKRTESGSNLTNRTSPSSYLMPPNNNVTIWKANHDHTKKQNNNHSYRKINYGHKRNNGSSIVDYQRSIKMPSSSPESQDNRLNYSHSFYQNQANLKLSPHTPHTNDTHITPQRYNTQKRDKLQNYQVSYAGPSFQKKNTVIKQENGYNAKSYLFTKKVQTQHYIPESSHEKQYNRSKSPLTTFTYTSPPKQSINHFNSKTFNQINHQQLSVRPTTTVKQIPNFDKRNTFGYHNFPYSTTYRDVSPSQSYQKKNPISYQQVPQNYQKPHPPKALYKSFDTKPISMVQNDLTNKKPKQKKNESLNQPIRNFSKHPQQNCFPKTYLTSLKIKQQIPKEKTNKRIIYKI